MKHPSSKNGNARVIANLQLDLSILEHQERLWLLRARKKRLRIAEVQRQIKVKGAT